MTNPVEAMARALAELQTMLRTRTHTAGPRYVVSLRQINTFVWKEIFASDDPLECTEFVWAFTAKRALQALKDNVSEEMVDAVSGEMPPLAGTFERLERDAAKWIIQTMIDAAMKEETADSLDI